MNSGEKEIGLREGAIDPLPQAVHFNVDLIDRSLRELNDLIKSAKMWFEDDNTFIRQNQVMIQECWDKLSKEVDATFDENSMKEFINKEGHIASIRILIVGGIATASLIFVVIPFLDQIIPQGILLNVLKAGSILSILGYVANNYMLIVHETHRKIGEVKETRLNKIKENKKEIMQEISQLIDKTSANRKSNGEMMSQILNKIGSSNENLAKLIAPLSTAIAARQIITENSTAIKQLRENMVSKLTDNLG